MGRKESGRCLRNAERIIFERSTTPFVLRISDRLLVVDRHQCCRVFGMGLGMFLSAGNDVEVQSVHDLMSRCLTVATLHDVDNE